jgi:hypothetical protein
MPRKIGTFACVGHSLVNYVSKTWQNQKINHSTSNYITHYTKSHKFVNIKAIINDSESGIIKLLLKKYY